MKKITNKNFALSRFRAFLLFAFCFLPFCLFAQGGTTGPLTWKLENGTLTISGTGAMPDYSVDECKEGEWVTLAPWGCKHYSSINAVVIERGVTNIGKCAFDGCQAIKLVDISNTVTKIGQNAFVFCHMKSIVLPHGVRTIDNGAFNLCGLTSITLPSSIISIGDHAFYYALTSITNLNPVPINIGSAVFEYVNISACTLKVPKGSVKAYERAEVWKEFKIEGIEVGVEELGITNYELKVYPNPATGTCNITIPEEFLYESSLTLSVYDMLGTLIQQTELNPGMEDFRLNIDSKAKGTYMVALSNERKSYRGKVVFN